jgi:hypothetical protein
LRAEVERLRAELHSEIARLRLELKHDLTVRLGAMIVAAVAVLGTLNVFF